MNLMNYKSLVIVLMRLTENQYDLNDELGAITSKL